ncbi:MAG: hypothetical protein ABI831_26990, partial [Betaproteobacteria bacterium]
DAGAWPCDLGGAAAVKVIARKTEAREPPPPKAFGAKTATTELQTHEVQDLADNIDALRQATAGHPLRIRITVEIGDGGNIGQSILEEVNTVLAKVKVGWEAK